jgi:hypothetical protein
MLSSKYGFTDVLEKGLIVLDPSRMAAQIVSGAGQPKMVSRPELAFISSRSTTTVRACPSGANATA